MKYVPLISIAMATYNGEKFLAKQLDSIYKQTYTNIEVIVNDDCSTDRTIEILEQYSKSHGLKYYLNSKNLGFLKNFEKVISLCMGDFIALADQDDIWEKNKLEILWSKLDSNLLIHSDCKIIDENNQIINDSWKQADGYLCNMDNLFFRNVVTGCTILFNTDLLKTALPFPNNLVYHDWWLALCAAKQQKIVYTPLCLTRYRQHIGQDTGYGNNKKIFILKRVYLNIKYKYYKIDFHRTIAYKKHLNNLIALQNSPKCIENSNLFLTEVINYFSDYVKHTVHLKTFFIGLKYHKIVYPKKNPFFIKNILLDIIG